MRITMLTTGGTIEKTFNEHDGSLRHALPTLPSLLAAFRLPDLVIETKQILFKDSSEMTDEDRAHILAETSAAAASSDAIIILHGTDTLEQTGELLSEALAPHHVPVILTGTMRPYEFRDTDAIQNVTEALLAARLVDPGVYVAMHNRILSFPGVVKNHALLNFEQASTDVR